MPAYYNEFDPFAAQWLRNLIADGLIAAGDVDERDIREVAPDDLRGYAQCHFFAGIGGWSYALRLAGWPDDRPVWTGSCPCQPFSAAGKREAGADERHLWPRWFRLIRECRPDIAFGEQVEAAVGMGWLDRVSADLEAEDYACGAAVLGAHSVGAPHIRQRLFWVADANGSRERRRSGKEAAASAAPAYSVEGHQRQRDGVVALRGGQFGWLADADGRQSRNGNLQPGGEHGQQPQDGSAGERLGDADEPRPRGWHEQGHCTDQLSPWASGILIPCADGKARRIEPSIFPLAYGVPNLVGTLRGAGNAIVPQVAAEFIQAFCEARELAA